MGVYKYIAQIWKKPKENFGQIAWRDRLTKLRAQPALVRLDYPTRLDRARKLGYKAKQGYFMVCSRAPKGGRKRPAIHRGRRPKRYGQTRFTAGVSKQTMAEQRAAKKYPNAEVLNSYWVAEDGKYKWYEIIFVDRTHPVIKASPTIKWITKKPQKSRVFRGLTSAGKKSRGLVRGNRSGQDKSRPSVRARGRRAK